VQETAALQTVPAPPSEGVSRRRRSAPLTEYMVLLVIQLALVTIITLSIGAWINSKWSALYSVLP
jgi:hypothetical protein